MIAFLAFAIPLSFYVSWPSCFWNFDGVACAAALELGQPAYFFHSNHLLYGFFGYLFWHWIGLPLGLSRSLPALQLFTSILAALGLIGLYRILLSVIENRWTALLLTVTMAVTAAFWVWSIEAQVYTLAFLALAWATFILLQYKGPHKYIYVGILHGGAILGHLMHVLWIIPALYWMVGENRGISSSISKTLKQYIGFLAAVTALPYFIVIGFVIAPGRDLPHIAVWLKGSLGITPDRHWAWHSMGWSGPWLWLKSIAPAIWGSFWPYGKTIVTPGIWALTALSILLMVAIMIRTWDQRKDRLARFSLLWLGVYGLFLSTWEPMTWCYRLPDVLPLGILLALGLRSWKASTQLSIASLLLVSTLTSNALTQIIPMHQSDRNPVYQETLALAKSTSPQSLYVTAGGTSWIYLLYFTGRPAWTARAFSGPQLVHAVGQLKRSHPVFIQSVLLRDPTLGAALATLKMKQWSEGSSWLQVQ